MEFSVCCEPVIKGIKNAPTAESLMRARYSAYVTGAVEFIEATHSLEKRDGVDIEETRKWSRDSDWHGLEIINTRAGKEGDGKGTVEFKASYSQKKMMNVHHEISTFKNVDGKWYYDEGKVIPLTVVRSEEKVGRNEPCPCGSGKKYKKCCG